MKKNTKRYIRKYFTFTRRETRGTVVLVLIIILLIIYRLIHPILFLPQYNNLNDVQMHWISSTTQQISNQYTFEEQLSSNDETPSIAAAAKQTITYFKFNPNTINADSLMLLGLSPKKVKMFINYRSKGAIFKSPDDLKKIFAFTEQDIERLRPWIDIPNAQETKATETAKQIEIPVIEKKPWLVDINIADSADFVSLPGIGPTLASRILKYRSRFGAFTNKEQLMEVVGITSEWFEKNQSSLIISKLPLKQLNINICTEDELKRLAYFDKNIAGILIRYRDNHGPFKSVSDIKNCAAISNEFYQKIEPYLKVN
jgi:competence ComEA-like helix-hairpin-helix protein